MDGEINTVSIKAAEHREETGTLFKEQNDAESSLRSKPVEGEGMTWAEWWSLPKRSGYDAEFSHVACTTINDLTRVIPETALEFTNMRNALGTWTDFVMVLRRYPEVRVLPDRLYPPPLLPFHLDYVQGRTITLGISEYCAEHSASQQIALIALIDRGDVDLDTVFPVRLVPPIRVTFGLLLGSCYPSPALCRFVSKLTSQSWSTMVRKWNPHQSESQLVLDQKKCHPDLWRCAIAQREELLLALQNGFAEQRFLPKVLAQMCAAYTLSLLPACDVPCRFLLHRGWSWYYELLLHA